MKTYTIKERIDCEILHFCDGDTVFVRAHCPCCGLSRPIYVRLKGIESHEPKGETRHLASAIAQKWNSKLGGKKAELLCTQIGSDRYGRVIGALFVEGINLAKTLVDSGDAWYQDHKTKKT